MRIAGSITVSLLLLASCASTSKSQDAPAPDSSDNGSTPTVDDGTAGSQDGGPDGSTVDLDAAARRQEVRRQADELIVEAKIDSARTLMQQGRLNLAALEIDQVLELDPDNYEAHQVGNEIARLMGDPSGEFMSVSRQLEEEWEIQQQILKSDATDLYDSGRLALSRGDYSKAIADLTLAKTHVDNAPTLDWDGMDVQVVALLERAKSDRVAYEEAQRLAEQQRAFDILREEEQAERDRRQAIVQNMIDKAADAFALRNFDLAQEYAEQALDLSPSNEKAYEIREASFRAGRDKVKEDYIKNKTEEFAKWKEHLDELQVPWTDNLTLPSKDEWRRITALRAQRRGLDLSQKITPEELALREQLQRTTVVLPGIEGEEEIGTIINIIANYTNLPLVVDPAAEEAVTSNGVIFDVDFPNPITVQQALDFLTEVGGEDVTWTVRHEAVLITTREKARGKPIPYYHDVQDLIMGLTDFTGPRIDRLRLLDELEDDDGGGPFGGILETQRLVEIEDLASIIQENVAVSSWDEDGVTIEPSQGGILITHSPEVQAQVRDFLEDLRRFNSSLVTIESKFMSVGDAWIQQIGVDFRGNDGIDLTDVTNGLEDMASQGLDNGGTGSQGSNAAGPPSSGLFYDDGGDGDFRGRTENFFDTVLGSTLNTVGGMTFQLEFINDLEVDMVLRAIEKTSKFELVNSQMLSVNNTQRAYVTVVNQKAYIQDFDVEVAQFQAVADPQINVLNEGVVLDVRPTIHHSRKYLTLEIQPTVAKVVNVRNFSTTLGGNTSPVNFELPELEVQSVNTSAVIPDGGSILLGGLSNIRNIERRAEVPWLANVPLLGFLFKQEGYNDERESLMILIKASIIDIRDQVAEKLETRY